MDIRSLPCLKEIPEWANFAAMDKSGFVFIYQYEPASHQNGTYWMGARLKRLDWAGMEYWLSPGEFWKKSLIELRDGIDPKYRREKSSK